VKVLIISNQLDRAGSSFIDYRIVGKTQQPITGLVASSLTSHAGTISHASLELLLSVF